MPANVGFGYAVEKADPQEALVVHESNGLIEMCKAESWSARDTWQFRAVYRGNDLVLSPCAGCRVGRMSEVRPRCTLLFFHSGARGPEDVLSYLPYLFSKSDISPQDVRIVAPCSPRRDFGDGWVLNCWHDYTTDRLWLGKGPDKVSLEQFLEQRKRLIGILEDEHNRLAPGGRLVLGGFSQGAALALDIMLHAPARIDSIAGCFCARGMFQGETLWGLPEEKIRQRTKSCPILVVHGKSDQIVPWHVARRSYKRLRTRGFRVKLKVEKWVSHSTESVQEYREVARFVSRAWNGGHCSSKT